MGKGQSFQQVVLGILDIHMQKNKVGLLSYIIYKTQPKIDQRPKTIKRLEENIGEGLHHTGFGKDLLAMTPRAQAPKEKKIN